MKTRTLKTVIAELVKSYIWKPESLVVGCEDLPNETTVTLQASGDDHPLIIGTAGKNIKALKSIVDRIGRKNKKWAEVILVDAHSPRTNLQIDPVPNPDWDERPMMAMLKELCSMALVPKIVIDFKAIGGLNQFTIYGPSDIRDFVEAIHTLFYAIGRVQGTTVFIKHKDDVKMA